MVVIVPKVAVHYSIQRRLFLAGQDTPPCFHLEMCTMLVAMVINHVVWGPIAPEVRGFGEPLRSDEPARLSGEDNLAELGDASYQNRPGGSRVVKH